MNRRGRHAALPSIEVPRTERGILASEDGLMVRAYAQDGGHRDFGFGDLPVSGEIQAGFAAAFAKRVAPGQGLTSMSPMIGSFRAIVRFAQHLSMVTHPPIRMRDIAPVHIDGYRMSLMIGTAGQELGILKQTLRRAEGISDELAGKLKERNPRRADPAVAKCSYSRDELRRIADTARSDLRAAAVRIRGNRELLRRLRAGDVAPQQLRRCQLLDWVDRHGDVPRCINGDGKEVVREWVTHNFGRTDDVVCWLHLSTKECLAAAILLTAMTGQNPSVILGTPAAHHRADGHTGSTATAIVSAVKPRRGSRAHMSIALSEVPDWISVPENPGELSTRDRLHTPFGVYVLLHELTARTREMIDTDRLLVRWASKAGSTIQGQPRSGRSFRPLTANAQQIQQWAAQHDLIADSPRPDAEPSRLHLTLELIRLTYLELHQKPVAHTEQTLATDYLARNRGNLREYQRVVAAALTEEVAKARTRGVMATLSAAQIEAARIDPESVAALHGVNARTLERMIGGRLDTVLAACADNTNSPHSPAGQPCRASFMLCLECPCARALPRHLPVQVLVHDRLTARRGEMTPLRWTQRFARPHAQLSDLLAQHDSAVIATARAAVTDAERDLVSRFLSRELDLR